MPTQEERLETVEFNLKQFKTETIKAYGDMAYETVILKGLGEDSIKRLAAITRQIETVDDRLSTIEHRLNQLEINDSKHTTILHEHTALLTQILERLPEKNT